MSKKQEEYKDIVGVRRQKFIERFKTNNTIEDIRELYNFFNVDDDVYISTEAGVQSLTPFGANGPKLEKGSSLEIYALDKYAREFAQNLVRVRFNQLIDPVKPEAIKSKKADSLK